MIKEKTSWIKHLLIRIFALPIIFLFIYIIILGGKSDPMGLGLIYAFLGLSAVGILFLIVEAVLLYRKRLMHQFYCNLFLLSVVLLSLFALLGAS